MSLPPTLRVGALELPYRHGDPDGMLRRLDDALAQARGLDLVVPCEALLTGYVSRRGDFDLTRFAEPLDGASVTALRALARAHGVALGAPWVERDGARCFNSYLVVDRAGATLAHYRKRRPWFPERWATPGDLGTPGFTLGGVRVTLAVCYDIHFVSRLAGAALDAADVLLASGRMDHLKRVVVTREELGERGLPRLLAGQRFPGQVELVTREG